MMVSGYPMTLFCMLMRYSFIRYRSSSISWSCSRGMEVKKRNWTVTSTESRVAREEWKTFVGKARLSREAKLAVFKLLFRPIITYRHESWIITERMQSQVQVAETRYPEECLTNNVGVARMDLEHGHPRISSHRAATPDGQETRAIVWVRAEVLSQTGCYLPPLRKATLANRRTGQ